MTAVEGIAVPSDSRKRIQVILPSSPLRDGAERQAFEAGFRWLVDEGHDVRGPSVLGSPSVREVAVGGLPWLAGSDGERAARLRHAIDDGGVDVVWMGRGGYGAARTLAAFAEARPACGPNRPWLWGFSDGTTLLAAWAKWGWPGWSAPPLTQLSRLDAPSLARVRLGLAGRVPAFEGLTTIVSGQAEGPLAGGNLTVLASLVGTPQMPSLAGSIVLIEDVGEAAYRVDRSLHQLRFAGAFDGVAGVVLGDFSGVSEAESEATTRCLDDFFGQLALPCAKGLPVGHATRNAPLPMGPADGWSARLQGGLRQDGEGWTEGPQPSLKLTNGAR